MARFPTWVTDLRQPIADTFVERKEHVDSIYLRRFVCLQSIQSQLYNYFNNKDIQKMHRLINISPKPKPGQSLSPSRAPLVFHFNRIKSREQANPTIIQASLQRLELMSCWWQ
jgi:hypothetical protein